MSEVVSLPLEVVPPPCEPCVPDCSEDQPPQQASLLAGFYALSLQVLHSAQFTQCTQCTCAQCAVCTPHNSALVVQSVVMLIILVVLNHLGLTPFETKPEFEAHLKILHGMAAIVYICNEIFEPILSKP